VTRVAGEEKFPQVIDFLARELAQGRQAYVVVPRVEDGGEARAAAAEAARLASHPQLRDYRVGVLHGRLAREAQREVMRAFVAGEVHVLVATTVIEVGVDVPNATMMVIENAERFGLTQLHQLRGRVGRGPHRSVCVLVPGPAAGSLARRRLDVLASTDNGFEIAEQDLELRGPGELWGTRQSGLPRLKLADLAHDQPLLEQAARAARQLVEADALLLDPAHAPLKETIAAGYREAIELAGGG
jgi:ATP-dependent DNA helicase RecG